MPGHFPARNKGRCTCWLCLQNAKWYQQRPGVGAGEEGREWVCEVEWLGRPAGSCSEAMSCFSLLISVRSWATSELAGGGGGGAGVVRDVAAGWATSMILSAMLAKTSSETVS